MSPLYNILQLVGEALSATKLVFELFSELIIDCLCRNTLLILNFQNFSDWFYQEFFLTIDLCSALSSPMSIGSSVLLALAFRQLEPSLSFSVGFFLLVTIINDVGCTTRITHILDFVFVDQVVITKVNLSAHVLNRFLFLKSFVPIPKTNHFHILIKKIVTQVFLRTHG